MGKAALTLLDGDRTCEPLARWQQTFLRCLRQLPAVRDACRAAKISRQCAYEDRKKKKSSRPSGMMQSTTRSMISKVSLFFGCMMLEIVRFYRLGTIASYTAIPVTGWLPSPQSVRPPLKQSCSI